MSEIKQINTGVAELLAILLPEGAYDFTVMYGSIFSYRISKKENRCQTLSPGNWTPLGIDTELTEEQCREVMPLAENSSRFQRYMSNESFNSHIGYIDEGCDTAKEAFASLMQSNGCYSVNPYGEEPNHLDYKFEKFKGELHFKSERDKNMYCDKWEQWKQAEENTGPHLILKNIL